MVLVLFSNRPVSTTSTVPASGLNLIVLSNTSPFVARDGGFTPPHIWRGRTVVQAGITYTITNVLSNASIEVSGGKTWSATDAPVIRKISSALKSPSISDSGTTIYYDLDQRVLRSRIGNQIVSTSNTDYPVWGTNFTGFHGTKATDSNGVVIIDLVNDHGVKQLLTHKPIVIATVDPTDLSGAENIGTVKAAYVVVQKYTTANSAKAVIAQTGFAATGSGAVTSNGTTLVAQAGDTSVSKFASGLAGPSFNLGTAGDTVYRYASVTGKLLESGYVYSVESNGYTLVCKGINSWTVGDIYVVHAQIRNIWLQVYYPSLTLAAGAAAATDSVLINTAGTQLYTSDKTARTVSTTTAAVIGI